MKDASKNNTVYRLRLSTQAFEVIIEAIHILSSRNQRFETLASVIATGTQLDEELFSKALLDLSELMPVDGDIKVFLRLTTKSHRAFERFRIALNERGMDSFGVREAVLACTLLIAPRN